MDSSNRGSSAGAAIADQRAEAYSKRLRRLTRLQAVHPRSYDAGPGEEELRKSGHKL
jgi:hypothetical protein